MEREPDLKPVYIYIVPKSKWPKKVKTIPFQGFNVDVDAKTYDKLGIEVIDAHSVEIDGREV